MNNTVVDSTLSTTVNSTARHSIDFTAFNFRNGQAFVETSVTNPLVGTVVAGVVSTGLYGICNLISYLKKKKSGKQAVVDTLKESGELGVSAGIGVVAGNAITATGLILVNTTVLPVAAGVTATFVSKRLWNKYNKKKKKRSVSLDVDDALVTA